MMLRCVVVIVLSAIKTASSIQLAVKCLYKRLPSQRAKKLKSNTAIINTVEAQAETAFGVRHDSF